MNIYLLFYSKDLRHVGDGRWCAALRKYQNKNMVINMLLLCAAMNLFSSKVLINIKLRENILKRI
jgi:hypothetical protein